MALGLGVPSLTAGAGRALGQGGRASPWRGRRGDREQMRSAMAADVCVSAVGVIAWFLSDSWAANTGKSAVGRGRGVTGAWPGGVARGELLHPGLRRSLDSGRPPARLDREPAE